MTGVAGGLAALVVLRLAMGAGEATFYPSALSLLSRNVAAAQRARATATMQFGALIGPAAGALLGGWLMLQYGWRAMFFVMGGASLALALLLAALDARERQARRSRSPATIRRMP